MRVDYDPVADALYFHIGGGQVVSSEEISPGVIVDYDEMGDVLGIEVLSYSKRKLDLDRLIRLSHEELVAEVAVL
ncbi:MAG: DUF2283 domain-containing protein [Candidatus Thorarchaeota archaeon]|nr:MAG: DUF2283 domain-containing protein [Candidatus Thorarchaeota archaeon]